MKVLTTPRSYGKTDPDLFGMLERAGLEVVRNETGGILSREAMMDMLAGCEGVIVGVDPLDAEVMAAAPKLRAIAKYGVGVDNIDLEAAQARGIKVSRTVGANAEAVADYAMTLILSVARRAAAIDRRCRQGDWKKITTRDVSGGVLGLLGLGAIGKLVARRAQGFGMTVLAHDPFWDEDYAAANRITRASPEEIYAQADVISLHLPLTEETRGIIGPGEIARMKPDAILINTARGGLIDEAALLDALEAGRLYGAGIDAFAQEPPADPRWFALDNVVLGSHCAASTAGAARNMGRMASFAFMYICKGIGMVSYQGHPPTIQDPFIKSLPTASFLGIPFITWVAIAMFALCYFIQERTAFGRHIYAVGTNESIPRSVGVSVEKVKVGVFTLAGFLFGVAGVIGAIRLGQGQIAIGAGKMFPAQAAVVVGGTSLAGGKGGVTNTIVGVLIMTVLDNGLLVLGVNPNIRTGIQGVIILVSVILTVARGAKVISK